jgi:hypothetical protein
MTMEQNPVLLLSFTFFLCVRVTVSIFGASTSVVQVRARRTGDLGDLGRDRWQA